MLGYVYDSEKIDSELREQLEGYGEAMLYFHINTAGGVRHRVKHNSSHQERPGAISVKDSLTVEEEMFLEQRFCIDQLKEKDILANPCDDDGIPTDEYWAWFRAWDSYVRGLPSEEWKVFEKALNGKADVSKWRPEGL